MTLAHDLIIHLAFLHTETCLMSYANSDGPNQNVNHHYMWWSGFCSSSGEWVCMQKEEGLIRLHKCLSLQSAFVDSYNIHLLLQWPQQFELLKRRSVKARGACNSCRFYVSFYLLHVYKLVVTFSIYFTKTEWLLKKDIPCSERR